MHKNQKGFGVIEIALIIIVAGVLGATSWYAFHSKAQTDKILNGAAAESQQSANVSSQGGIQYSVVVPAGFKTQLQALYNNFKPTCAVVAPGPVEFKVLKNVSDQQIQVSQTCGGVGGSDIYILQGSKWVAAALSTGVYACTDVDEFKISKQLAPTCYVTNLDGSQTIRENTNP